MSSPPLGRGALLAFLFLSLISSSLGNHDGGSGPDAVYANEYVVHLDGNIDTAQLLGLKKGFELVGEVRV